jgi:hypothetical protein
MEKSYRTFNRYGYNNRIRRISWKGVFAGTLVALAVAFLLNLLGLGVGFSTINPMTESDPLAGLGTGTLIWLAVSNLLALFLGGWVAAHMAGYPAKQDGGLHGLLTWALFTMITLYLMSSTIGSVVNGLSGAISGLFGGGQKDKVTVVLDKAQKRSEQNTGFSYDKIKREAFKLINTGERYNVLPDDASETVREDLNKVEADTKQAFNDLNLDRRIDEFFNDLSVDLDNNGNLKVNVEGDGELINKQELKDYLVNNTQLSEAEINGLINKWENNIKQAIDKAEEYYAKARQKAIEYSDKVADAIATVSIWAFVILLLGALTAFLGGYIGAPILSVDEERREEIIEERRS